jgi:hypothetical protein
VIVVKIKMGFPVGIEPTSLFCKRVGFLTGKGNLSSPLSPFRKPEIKAPQTFWVRGVILLGVIAAKSLAEDLATLAPGKSDL